MSATPENGDDHAELAFLEPADLDGHTIDELTDYVDAGMQPADPSIDESPACRNAIAAIVRLRAASASALEAAALESTTLEDGWVSEIMSAIALESRAGRRIPLHAQQATEQAALTEGAVRALIRQVGDSIDGVLVGKCTLDGDVTELAAPVRIHVAITVLWGNDMHAVADRVRRAVHHALLEQTELTVTGVDIEVRDVLLQRAEKPEVER